ncbi:MAG: hypothetical protein P0Y64_16560 [Candidatus Sphingomonas colombiensis]|nr:hypothetical protein [Sphingomonas sp.]WEK42931.1 MAG: hypothetical protein P0Y64_16560 [Sphingomonas sp.]
MTQAEKLIALAERVEAGEIRALSIKQPYPHHIFHDGKDVENRDWPTKGRGWVIVHAGKATDGPTPKSLGELPRGGVVGMMKITDCVEQMDSDWFFGRYCFVIGEAFPLPLIPCRGMLGFFRLDEATNAATAAALRARAERGM